MIIKIAIPTDDKINISGDLVTSEFYKIYNVECGRITSEVFLKNRHSKSENKKEEAALDKICKLLFDCEYIITNGVSDGVKEYFAERKKETVITCEKILSNIIYSFISELARKESDTCCCP